MTVRSILIGIIGGFIALLIIANLYQFGVIAVDKPKVTSEQFDMQGGDVVMDVQDGVVTLSPIKK